MCGCLPPTLLVARNRALSSNSLAPELPQFVLPTIPVAHAQERRGPCACDEHHCELGTMVALRRMFPVFLSLTFLVMALSTNQFHNLS